MFPHTITIYRHSVVNGADNYSMTILNGCYWYSKASIAGSGKGTERTNSCTIVTSPELAAKYGLTWDVQPGDRVVKGHDGLVGASIAGVSTVGVKTIGSLRELPTNAMTIKAVEENVCGSSVDNITLIG